MPRLPEVDALRGFALLGIVAVNSTQIAGSWAWSVDPEPVASVSYVARFLVTVAFATKFYLLFSFLFGYSFTLQVASAQRVGARFRSRHLRRLAVLLVLGVAHAVLLYVGDILTTYAVLGLALFALRAWEPGAATRLAALILGGLGACYLLLGLLLVTPAPMAGAGTEGEPVLPAAELAVKYRGPPGDVVAANLELLPDALASIAIFQAPCAFAMFLLGLAAGKRGLLAGWFPAAATLRRIAGGGAVAGLPGGVLLAMATHGVLPGQWLVVALGVNAVTAPALSAAYACALLLAMRGSWGRRVRDVLAAAGRLALTNYLLQSVLLMLVFTGYGLALYDRLGGAQVVAVAFAIYAAQLVASACWVRYLRYGPAEWVLRAGTYARFPGMR